MNCAYHNKHTQVTLSHITGYKVMLKFTNFKTRIFNVKNNSHSQYWEATKSTCSAIHMSLRTECSNHYGYSLFQYMLVLPLAIPFQYMVTIHSHLHSLLWPVGWGSSVQFVSVPRWQLAGQQIPHWEPSRHITINTTSGANVTLTLVSMISV